MKKTHKILATILACTIPFSLCACGGDNSSDEPPNATYTIQYADDTGIHSIEVKSGELYSISTLPERNGYIFTGLYDAEIGGTQYVNAGGSSLSEYNDKKNMVLYPQFRAKEYTLVLDYQGAVVTGSRSLTVGYDSLINDLPMNLTMENKNFVGWYTQPDKQGIQVADQYGVIPSKNIVDESVFDLSDPKGYIYLYAGFKGEEFIVTFYATESGVPEEIKVEYGTPISQVQLETRVNGNAVIAWSKKKNDTNKEEVFNGKVTGEMVLYAAEYAPVIDFNCKGGKNINSLIARAGDAVKLPTPIRDNYKFIGWQDGSGNVVNYSTMPENSIKLNAKWQAMIVFDTNGGKEVENISEFQGTKITLPKTEKTGYMFAGWYDAKGEKYEDEAMPSTSIKLVAKYWRVEKAIKVLIDETNVYYMNRNSNSPNIDFCSRILNLEELYNNGIRNVNMIIHYQSLHEDARSLHNVHTYMTWYSTNIASEPYKILQLSENHTDGNYESYVHNFECSLVSPKIYICHWHDCTNGSHYSTYWKDFYIEIEYPDMSTLY